MGDYLKQGIEDTPKAGLIFDDVIYVIACILSLGLVYLITIIIEKGVSNPVGYLTLITKDIEIEVSKIKEDVAKIKLEIEDIKRLNGYGK